MWQVIINFLKGVFGTFSTTEGGHSARKWSAFAAFLTSAYLAIKNTDPSNVTSIVTIYLVFALLCMGLVTVQDIIKFKGGNDNTNQ